jgi:hypothetical protein
MARKMNTFKAGGQRVAGLCKVKPGRDSFTLVFRPKDGEEPYKATFENDALPEHLLDSGFELQRGEYWARLYKDELADIRPAAGAFIGRFKGLALTEDGDVWFQISEDRFNKGKMKGQFIAEIVVDKGENAGCVFPKYITFTSWDTKTQKAVPMFGADQDGYLTMAEFKGLMELFNFSGVMEDCDIQYTDDMAELFMAIHKKVKKLSRSEDNRFRFTVESGYPKELEALTAYDEDDDEDDIDEDDEEVPAKKSKPVVEEDDDKDEKPAKKSRPKFDEDED